MYSMINMKSRDRSIYKHNHIYGPKTLIYSGIASEIGVYYKILRYKSTMFLAELNDNIMYIL
jgi:hypothetical protein